jgi:hypothetical protein
MCKNNESEGNYMAKKPLKEAPLPPKASKQTKDAIDLFNGKKRGEEVLLVPDGRTTRKFQHSGYVKTANDKFWEFVEDRKVGSIIVLGITTAIVSFAVYWVMTR